MFSLTPLPSGDTKTSAWSRRAFLSLAAPCFLRSTPPVADLMRVRSEYPDCNARVAGRCSTHDGLTADLLYWPAEDGTPCHGYLVRPRDITRHAVICLHGSTTTGEAVALEPFGHGTWPPYRGILNLLRRVATGERHKLLGWGGELARRGYLSLSLTLRGYRAETLDMLVKESLLSGRWLIGQQAQEVRQAITYLFSRESIDTVSIVGMSTGGAVGLWAWLLDDRAHALASICGGLGSMRELLRDGHSLYHSAYFWPPDMFAKVGDQADVVAVAAPRPLFVCAPLDDVGMPRNGVDEFERRVRPTFGHYLQIYRPPGGHEFTIDSFQRVVTFLNTSRPSTSYLISRARRSSW